MGPSADATQWTIGLCAHAGRVCIEHTGLAGLRRMGAPASRQLLSDRQRRVLNPFTTRDTAWTLVLRRLGVAGSVVLVAVSIGFGARAFGLFMTGAGDREYLGHDVLVRTLGLAPVTGSLRSSMQPGALPMGLWPSAFMATQDQHGDDGLPEPKAA